MSKRLFHTLGFVAALIGFLFFRLWPSSPPLSVTQDDYLQRIAAARPAPPLPQVIAPVPVLVAVPAEPATVVTPPVLMASMPPPLPAALPVAPSPKAEAERTAIPAKPRSPVRTPTSAAQLQGVNARFPRHDVQPGQKTGRVVDYGPQFQALDAFSKKSGRGG